MFSVGILYRTQEFLEFLTSNRLTVAQFKDNFPSFQQVGSEYVLAAAHTCNWVETTAADVLQLTAAGKEIIGAGNSRAQLRLQIRDLLRFSTPRPTWAALLPRGRSAVRHFANPDVVQCFRDAGLMDDPNEEIASWWDSISVPMRESHTAHLVEVGRKGEWYSIEYEEARVGRRPEWKALDNSEAGYDLVSVVSRSNSERHIIEVKATERPWNAAQFFLSRNEWDVLISQEHASLHLWSFDRYPPLLCAVAAKSLHPHIPRDGGHGKWYKAELPFMCIGEGFPIKIGPIP